MNTEPQYLKNQALELGLQSRRETLPPESRDFLDQYLKEHPEVAREIDACCQFLDGMAEARVPLRSGHREALYQRFSDLVRTDVLSEARPANAGFLARVRQILLGVEAGVTRRRLVLRRSLALVLGIVMALAIYSGQIRGSDPVVSSSGGSIAEALGR